MKKSLAALLGLVLCAGAAAAQQPSIVKNDFQIDAPDLIRVYGRQLLLVRPDQHVAWRGSGCESPDTASAIIARALGWQKRSM